MAARTAVLLRNGPVLTRLTVARHQSPTHVACSEAFVNTEGAVDPARNRPLSEMAAKGRYPAKSEVPPLWSSVTASANDVSPTRPERLKRISSACAIAGAIKTTNAEGSSRFIIRRGVFGARRRYRLPKVLSTKVAHHLRAGKDVGHGNLKGSWGQVLQ